MYYEAIHMQECHERIIEALYLIYVYNIEGPVLLTKFVKLCPKSS